MNKRGLTLVKAVFLISLLMIFISLANSIFAISNDNEYVKEFEKGDLNYGKITIKDGINGNIAEYVLERNTDQCLIDCYAEGTAKLYSDGILFSALKFYGPDKNLKNIRDSKILIENNESYEIEIKDSQTICEQELLINGTYRNTCRQEITGSHKETRYKIYWKEYNGEILNTGNYKWRIEGKKPLNENIDWIADAFGNEFNDWAWWNSSWQKKREIIIQETSGTSATNYSVLLNIAYNESMKSDFSDLRFINDSSELNYYIENKTDGVSAKVWVKIPNLIASQNTTIYMYYNNSAALDKSNANNSFLYFTDFDDNAEFTNNWDCSQAVCTIGNSYVNYDSNGINHNHMVMKNLNLTNYAVRTRGKTSGWAFTAGLRAQSPNGADSYQKRYSAGFGYATEANSHVLYDYTTDEPNSYSELAKHLSITGTAGVWYQEEVTAFGTNISAFKYFDNGTLQDGLTGTDGDWLSGYPTLGYGVSNDGYNDDYDWYRVRNFVNPEPAIFFGIMGLQALPNTSTPILNSTDGTNRSNQDLNCYATLTDNEQTNLTAYWKWYKNNISYLSGNNSVTNGTYSLIATLSSGNLTKGEQWSCEITPFNGYNNGTAQNSSSLTILNSPPTQTNPLLKTPTGKNLSTENLTCYNQSTNDADKDNITNIYNWYKNSQPFLALNLPFETNVDDYSGYNNNGVINGNPQFATGKYGRALEFDGIDDYVDISDSNSNSLDITEDLTLEAWIYPTDLIGSHTFIVKGGENWVYVNYLLRTSGDEIEFKWYNSGFEMHKTTNVNLAVNNWYHIIAIHDVVNNVAKIYVNGEEKLSESTTKTKLANMQVLSIGTDRDSNGNPFLLFNGSIDEVKVYPYTLTQEQIKQRYEETKDGLTTNSTIVSQETSGGDVYMCQVTPNDGEVDGVTLNSSSLNVLWAITFNVTSGETAEQLTNFNINCNNSFSASGVNSPYETGFLPGGYDCTFSKIEPELYYNTTITFTADNDKTVNVKMSKRAYLTIEEHTWLEWLYNCWHNGDCWDLLKNINQTTTQIWQRLTGTDRSVITQEKVLSYTLNASSNITINYTITLPHKEGVAVNELLPIRLYFWFTDVNRTQCYSQDKETNTNKAEAPYCLPLVAEILGPNDGTVTFKVDLRPNLPVGIYNFTRSIEIDPLGIWTQYGRENIGQVKITENGNANIDISDENRINKPASSAPESSGSSSSAGSGGGTTIIKEREIIKLVPQENKEKTSGEKTKSEEDKTETSNKGIGITGAVIGANLLSNSYVVTIVTIICLTFIVFVIVTSRTILKLKRKN